MDSWLYDETMSRYAWKWKNKLKIHLFSLVNVMTKLTCWWPNCNQFADSFTDSFWVFGPNWLSFVCRHFPVNLPLRAWRPVQRLTHSRICFWPADCSNFTSFCSIEAYVDKIKALLLAPSCNWCRLCPPSANQNKPLESHTVLEQIWSSDMQKVGW